MSTTTEYCRYLLYITGQYGHAIYESVYTRAALIENFANVCFVWDMKDAVLQETDPQYHNFLAHVPADSFNTPPGCRVRPFFCGHLSLKWSVNFYSNPLTFCFGYVIHRESKSPQDFNQNPFYLEKSGIICFTLSSGNFGYLATGRAKWSHWSLREGGGDTRHWALNVAISSVQFYTLTFTPIHHYCTTITT